MNYTYIGKIVSTHGIKGEIRIISNFEYKDTVFKKGIAIYIGNEKQKEIINSYRHHKNYEMITLDGYYDINKVLKFMKKNVYIIKESVEELKNEILIEDLIGLDAYINNNKIGIVKDIYNTGINYKVFEVKNENDKILIPYNYDFIENIDISNNKIIFKGGNV